MKYPVRLKTGFFETTPCALSIEREGVALTPTESKHRNIRVMLDDIIAVTFTMKRYLCFEIQTRDRTFSGIFSHEVDCRQLEHQFTEYLGSRVFTEKD